MQAHQRHRPEFLARNEAFTCAFSHFSQSPVSLFYVQHVERKQTWDNYKEKVAKKRRNDKGAAAAAGVSDGITVQRLSSQVEGKCQTYSRIGPKAK